jgi:hypothetical protein
MFQLTGMWLVGVILAVFAFSARSIYEELDQDMPYIVWPTLIMQWVGYTLLAYSLYTNGASPWLVGGATLLLVAQSITETWYLLDSTLAQNMLLLLGVMGVAAAIILPSNQTLGGVAVTLLGAVAVILAQSVILPAEQDRRLSSGPGMALLILGWLLMGLSTVSPSVSIATMQVMSPGASTLNSLGPASPLGLSAASPLGLSAASPRAFSL